MGHPGLGLLVGRGDQADDVVRGSRGHRLAQVPIQDVRTFLADTEALVPRGAESGHIDWELELANLFAKG